MASVGKSCARTCLITILVIAVISLGLKSASQAGMVRLKNGDVVTGKILKVSGGDIIVETDYAGEVTIKADSVVDLQSDRPLTVEYGDGREVNGYIDVGPDGQLVVREAAPSKDGAEVSPDEAAGMELVNLTDIEDIHEVHPYFRYTANVEFGLSIAKGNSDNENINLAASFVPTFGKNTIAIDGQVNRGKSDGEVSESNWRVNGQYEREFWDQWFWLLFNSYEHDALQDLDLRITAATGIGYKFFEPDPTLLKVSLGPAFVDENFKGSDDDRQFAALRWTLDFDQDLWSPDVSIYHYHRVTMGLTEDQFIILTVQGLRLGLIADLALLLEFQFDHNENPADDAKPDDYRYLVKLAYDFKGDQNDWWN
jgi:putative salt-induced outer membrane protein YdiY